MLGKTGTILTSATIEQYRSWCTGRGRAPNTVKAYCSDLTEFLKAAGENGTVSHEEYEELAMSWLNLTRNVVSPKTTARRLTSLRSFGKWIGLTAPLADYVAPVPSKTIPHPIPEGADGLRRMISCAKNPEQAALVAAGGFIGCRISESLSLTVDSFDVPQMLLTIRGKGDKTRTVPISDEALHHMSSAYVLAHAKPDKRLISYKDRFARQLVTNLAISAGLRSEHSSHDLRATFATEAYGLTKDIRVVQELLGHSSSETTEIYTGISLARMREAVQF